jgi:hypothetical protein
VCSIAALQKEKDQLTKEFDATILQMNAKQEAKLKEMADHHAYALFASHSSRYH